MTSDIRIRRIYEAPAADDGARVLVDRVWPRGMRKADAHLDTWLKDVAPSSELRAWYGHDPAKADEFRRRYLAELAAPLRREALERLGELALGERLTLLTATRDLPLSHAVVVADVLRTSLARQAADTGSEGGDPACFAHLVCPDCGAVVTEGHAPSCPLA